MARAGRGRGGSGASAPTLMVRQLSGGRQLGWPPGRAWRLRSAMIGRGGGGRPFGHDRPWWLPLRAVLVGRSVRATWPLGPVRSSAGSTAAVCGSTLPGRGGDDPERVGFQEGVGSRGRRAKLRSWAPSTRYRPAGGVASDARVGGLLAPEGADSVVSLHRMEQTDRYRPSSVAPLHRMQRRGQLRPRRDRHVHWMQQDPARFAPGATAEGAAPCSRGGRPVGLHPVQRRGG